MDKHIVVGVHITDRVKHAVCVQEVLTKYGCLIKTRIGLHEVGADCCSPSGVLILELLDRSTEVARFVDEMSAVEGVEVKQMVFDHP